MRNPWVGLDLAAEPMQWARLLRRAHELAVAGSPPPAIVRDVVTCSWERSRLAGIDPDVHQAPFVHDEHEIRERWQAHPLARFSDLIARMLCAYTYDSRHIVVISDAEGCLLWSDGHRGVLKASDTIAFVPGRVWTEAATGTNGVGTALALGHPVQIFSAEHFNRQIHGWTCSGAPVRDPESGETIGVLDLSSGIRVAHPNSLALVTAAAEMVAAQLTVELFERDARVKGRYLQRLGVDARQPSALVSPTGRMIAAVPAGWLPRRIPVPESGGGTVTLADGAQVEVEPLPRGEGFLVVGPGEGRTRGQPALRVRLLDRERGLLTVGGRVVTLSPRHSEMVALLILHPDGLTSEELAQQLYGDPAKRMSVRAEIARLRRVIGARCATNPYRLTGEVSSDLHDVERLLDLGRRQSARKLARGPLLPGAQAPAIVAAREQLERRLGRVGVPVLP